MINYGVIRCLIAPGRTTMSNRISGTIPDELDRDMDALFNKGYSPSDIVREAVRDLILKKKREGVIPV